MEYPHGGKYSVILICAKFPDGPIRHGNKYWTWLHWYLDVEITHLLRAKSVTVRCHNVFKNTQPERPTWNIMGYVFIFLLAFDFVRFNVADIE